MKCPYCAEQIQDDAIKCRFCGEWLARPTETGEETTPSGEPESAVSPGREMGTCCLVGCVIPLILFVLFYSIIAPKTPEEAAERDKKADQMAREWRQSQIKSEIENKIQDAQDRGDPVAEVRAKQELEQLQHAQQRNQYP